jgi:hypothetical protein
VVVDEAVFGDEVAAQVQFADRSRRQLGERIQGGVRILAVVALVDVEVIQVEHDAAAGAARQRGQEFGFAHRVAGKAQVGGDILDQDAALQHRLHPLDAGGDQVEACCVQAQRQQVVQLAAAQRAPAQVLGDEAGFERRGQLPHALQMVVGKAVDRAQTQADAVQADRIVAAQAFQNVPVPARAGQVIFRMHFQPAQRRALFQQLADMRRAQANAGPARRARLDHVLLALPALFARLRRGRLAAGLLAAALGHGTPLGRIVVDRRLAGAAMGGGAAIVLAGLGHAIAFFHFALGLHVHLAAGRCIGGAHARERGSNECLTFIHE